MPDGLLPICHWGCGIYSFIDCETVEAAMWACDPHPGTDGNLCREPMRVATWLERWIEGTPHQPAIIEDPNSGEWRPASDADWLEWAEDEG